MNGSQVTIDHVSKRFGDFVALDNINFTIKPGEFFNIKVHYLNDQVIYSNLGNPTITLWLLDINGRLWSQSFSCPDNEVGVPYLNNINNFRAQTSVETAIQCFKDPMLW